MSDKKYKASKLPPPFKGVSTSKPSYAVHPEINWRTVAEKPNWQEWKYTPQVQVWEACALSLDIEPSSIKKNPISWQTGPYADQLFEDESFQSENEKKEFKNKQRILLNNLNSKENFLWFSPCPNRPNLGEVSLSEFAAWCSSVEWPIPKELAALAKDNPQATSAVDAEHDDSKELSALFDPVPVEALEKMFPAGGKWKDWAERAKRNGLIAARRKRGMFNPYEAAMWFKDKNIAGFDLSRCNRVLANNLPARSSYGTHFFTSKID